MKTKGNTILITGGTSGIGRGLAEEFVLRGNTVIICGRRTDRLEEIGKIHPDIITRTCDVSIPEQREALYSWAAGNYPGLNVLVNNAGIQLPIDLTKAVASNRLTAEIEINFTAPVHLSTLFAEHLAGKDEAAIINISSGLAFVPLSFMPVYCATKAAIHSFTKSLRHQLRNSSVKVFEIIPPSVDSELGHERRKDKSQTHGGMPVKEFVGKMMQALESNIFEAAIGDSQKLREKGESLFNFINK